MKARKLHQRFVEMMPIAVKRRLGTPLTAEEQRLWAELERDAAQGARVKVIDLVRTAYHTRMTSLWLLVNDVASWLGGVALDRAKDSLEASRAPLKRNMDRMERSN